MKIYEIRNVFTEKIYGTVAAESAEAAMRHSGVKDVDAYAFMLTKKIKIAVDESASDVQEA